MDLKQPSGILDDNFLAGCQLKAMMFNFSVTTINCVNLGKKLCLEFLAGAIFAAAAWINISQLFSISHKETIGCFCAKCDEGIIPCRGK